MASRGQQLWQFMAVCGYYSVTDKSLYFLVLKKPFGDSENIQFNTPETGQTSG